MEDVVALGKPAGGEPQGQGAGGVAGDGHVVLPVRHAGKQGGGVHRLNDDGDPRLGQLLLHEGGQAGAVGGAGQGVSPAVIAPLLQQGLRPLHVPAPGQAAVIPRAGGEIRGRRLPQALGRLEAQGLLVQGQVDGPADGRAGDGLVVEHQLVEVVGHRALRHRQARLLGHLGVLHRHVAAEGVVVQIPGDQGGEQVGLVDDPDHQLVKAGRPQLVILVGLQHQLAARGLGDEFAGAGADGLVPQLQIHEL